MERPVCAAYGPDKGPIWVACATSLLAFSAAGNFATSTNGRAHVPEQTVSPFSQMAELISHNALPAAAGRAMAAASPALRGQPG